MTLEVYRGVGIRYKGYEVVVEAWGRKGEYSPTSPPPILCKTLIKKNVYNNDR